MNQREYYKTPMGKYIRQRANAHARAIAWEFTFDTWWKMWQESGKWEQRGRGVGCYYMCRTGDTGPYSPENCRIDTISANQKESWAVRKAALLPKKDPFEPYPRTSAWDYPYTSDWLRFSRQEHKTSTLKESA